MEKSKPKRKSRSRETIDFSSPFPLEICVSRLEDWEAQERKQPPPSRLRILVIPVDEDTYRFALRKRSATLTTITTEGFLKRRDANSTLVVGHTSGSLSLVVIACVISSLFLICALFLNQLSVVLPGIVIALVAAIFERAYARREEVALERLLHHRLTSAEDVP